MDDVDRAELEAAIVAHCQWLEKEHVRLPEPPDLLTAFQVFQYAKQLAGAKQLVVPAVLANLQALCAFRARATMSQAREAARESARLRVEEAEPHQKANAKRALQMIIAGTDESHIKKMTPALTALEGRLRTGERVVDAFAIALEKRHKAAAKQGFNSLHVIDVAQARWIASTCRRLAADLEFFRAQVAGQEILPHSGPTDGKAWYALRAECLVQLKEARVNAVGRRGLLPPARPLSDVPGRRKKQERQRVDKDGHAIKRATIRRKSKG